MSLIILIFLPTIGIATVLPTYSLYLLSFGFTAIAVSPSIVSGLVVAIVMNSEEFSILVTVCGEVWEQALITAVPIDASGAVVPLIVVDPQGHVPCLPVGPSVVRVVCHWCRLHR